MGYYLLKSRLISWFSNFSTKKNHIDSSAHEDRKFSLPENISLPKNLPKQGSISAKMFMAYAGKNHKANFSLPVNFDIQEHIQNFPPERYGFPADLKFEPDKAMEWLRLLSSIPTRKPDLITEDGFVPIHIQTVAKGIKDIKKYRDYLIKTGVIITDSHYIVGKKSIGYKWTVRYEDSSFVFKRIAHRYGYKKRNNSINNVNEEDNKDIVYIEDAIDQENYRLPNYLDFWYNDKLTISDGAEQYAEQVRTMRLKDKTKEAWELNLDTYKRKSPNLQYMSAILSIGKLRETIFDAHIDSSIHRLHSVLTNLKKDYRNFIKYDGEELVSVDIKNCQPYLCCLILRKEFWDRDSTLPVNINTLYDNIKDEFFKCEMLMDEIDKYFSKADIERFEHYKGLACSGDIYEFIKRQSPSPISRDEAKKIMFYMLFSSNKGGHKDPQLREMKKNFEKKMFPEVSELFRTIKNKYKGSTLDKPHSRLSRLLQSIESHIILHRCCKRIWDECDGAIPIFTIHDSIVTTKGNEDYVQMVLKDELFGCIGLFPKFSVEAWTESNLDGEILNMLDGKEQTTTQTASIAAIL